MQALASLLNNPAMSVFLGTLPLLGAILWGLLQNDRRLNSIEQRLGCIENRVDAIDDKLMGVSEWLVKVETKLEGGQLIVSR